MAGRAEIASTPTTGPLAQGAARPSLPECGGGSLLELGVLSCVFGRWS
jgi:hypothetical protein